MTLLKRLGRYLALLAHALEADPATGEHSLVHMEAESQSEPQAARE